MEPIPSGGVEIYAPIKTQKETKLENGETLYEVTIDNGSKDGIKVEYKAQKGKNDNGNVLQPVIFYDEKNKELSLRNLDRITVFGSEIDDNIKSTCTNSIFHFKQGGQDNIEQSVSSFRSNGNKVYIDSSDTYKESKICRDIDDLDDDDIVFDFPFKKFKTWHGSEDDKPTLINDIRDGYDIQ